MAEVFVLKHRDTLPALEVSLLEPDPANPGAFRAHDLTGSSAWKLHIRLNDDPDTVVTRDMTVVGNAEDGVLRYAWAADDWDEANPDGYLIAGPTPPLAPGEREHRMEYEVIGNMGAARLTFPNDGYDVLRVVSDIGQG